MIRVVFDTNVIISGSLWSGAPKRALMAAKEGYAKSFVSEALLDELNEVINRAKFSERLTAIGKTTHSVVSEFLQFSEVIDATYIPPTVLADPDDDAVISCALSANANCIVTGDPHLLDLRAIGKISILSVNIFLQQLFRQKPS